MKFFALTVSFVLLIIFVSAGTGSFGAGEKASRGVPKLNLAYTGLTSGELEPCG